MSKTPSYYSPADLSKNGLLATMPSEKTVRNMIRDGRLKAVNLTKGTRRNTWGISQAEIDRFNLSILEK